MHFHTLYNVETLAPLNGPDYDSFQIWASRILIGIAIFGFINGLLRLFNKVPGSPKALEPPRQTAIRMIVVSLVLFGGLGLGAQHQAAEYTKMWHRYQSLKIAMQKGECKFVEGDIKRIGRDGHYGCCYRIGDHDFYVPLANVFRLEPNLSPIKPGTVVRVWYANLPGWINNIPEQIARIDIADTGDNLPMRSR